MQYKCHHLENQINVIGGLAVGKNTNIKYFPVQYMVIIDLYD